MVLSPIWQSAHRAYRKKECVQPGHQNLDLIGLTCGEYLDKENQSEDTEKRRENNKKHFVQNAGHNKPFPFNATRFSLHSGVCFHLC